jgi:hypothetical protein
MEVDGDEEPGPQRCECNWLYFENAILPIISKLFCFVDLLMCYLRKNFSLTTT